MDNDKDRLLPTKLKLPDLTPHSCIEACREMNNIFAGVEAGSECFCGDTVPTELAPGGDCDHPCEGDISEICGGNWRMNVYTTSNST